MLTAGAPFNRKCAFDAMDYGLGVSANSLELVSSVYINGHNACYEPQDQVLL